MDKSIKILEMIAKDMKDDAEKFDGRPFNGKTVAEYFGNQGAAITALANIMKSTLQTNAFRSKDAADKIRRCHICGIDRDKEQHKDYCSAVG